MPLHRIMEKMLEFSTVLSTLSPYLTVNYTHTHPFKGPFSGTNLVSRYQKGKTNLDFTDPRYSEWQWHHLGFWAICKSVAVASAGPYASLHLALDR